MLALPTGKGYYVYILECLDHSYYTGWTNDLEKRYTAHVQGKGARYTKAHPPIACVYYEVLANKQTAMKREYQIKQYNRKEKEALIQAFQKQNSEG